MNASHAVMIVDVQRAFSPPPEFVARIERYSRRFSCRILTRFVNPPRSLHRRVLREKSCAPGSTDLELLISPRAGDVVFDKIGRYGLTPAQVRRLQSQGIRRVTVCGLDTDACVLAVMFALFDAGIECRLREDLSWSSTGLQAQALAIVRAQFRPVRKRMT